MSRTQVEVETQIGRLWGLGVLGAVLLEAVLRIFAASGIRFWGLGAVMLWGARVPSFGCFVWFGYALRLWVSGVLTVSGYREPGRFDLLTEARTFWGWPEF